jgi:hypothetical protein
MTHEDMDDGGIIELPVADTDPTVEAIAEYLREPGARLCDNLFFPKLVRPLYTTFGRTAVDAALRQIHGDIERRAAWEIRQLRNNAARLKRELKRGADGLQT